MRKQGKQAGNNPQHPQHAYATRLQSQVGSEKGEKGAQCIKTKTKEHLNPHISTLYPPEYTYASTIETTITRTPQMEKRQTKKAQPSEEKSQTGTQLKPQQDVSGEHNVADSHMTTQTVLEPDRDRDIIKRIVQDNDADMINKASGGSRNAMTATVNMADNRARQPEGVEKSEEGDLDIKKLLNSLPTKDDIQEMMSKWLGPLKVEMEEIRLSAEILDKKVLSCTIAQGLTDARVDQMEDVIRAQHQKLLTLQLQVEENENRNRRNNIRIKGISEAVTTADLRGRVSDIFNELLGKSPDDQIELDRVHRIPTGPYPTKEPPRDVLCRVHFFRIKEAIMRAAWLKGPMEINKDIIQMFPDLSQQTRARRRKLKPLLDLIRMKGGSYSWGYPISLNIKRDGETFHLDDIDQLPELFKFLGSEVIEVPNWKEIQIIPNRVGTRQRGRSSVSH